MNIEISLSILLYTVVIFAASQYVLFYFFRNQTLEQDKKIKALKTDIQALLLCSRGVGEKISHQQLEFKQIRDRQDQLEMNEGGGSTSYQQIIALMNRGASTDEVANSCDLTQGEIELLAHLKKKQNQSRTARTHLAA